MKKALMIILLAVAGSYNTANAQQPAVVVSDKTGWHKIGETRVSFEKDRDEVMVIGANRFASLKFKVTEAPIDLVSLTLHFDNGETQDMPMVMHIKSPGESKVIDIKGGERDLRKISFVYKTLPNAKDVRAHIEIWGLKTNVDKKMKDEKNSSTSKN